ncbi:MAG: amidohydrolase [Desulfobacteraceae bacterium]|jgi:5-methylthioadenosine/S-adenosylhomocysteine deaminase
MKGKMVNQADKLITNGMVMTVDAQGTIIENGAVAITGSKITAVGAASDLRACRSKEIIDAAGKLIMPGLVNGHTHMPMSLFRGLADDLPLEQWLQETIFPAEAQFITPANVRMGTLLSAAEMLLSGITTCCDGYFLADHIAHTVSDSGLRAVLGQGVIDFPAPGVPDPNKNVATAADFVRDWQDRSSLITPSIFCHSPYTCASETLKAAKEAANELGVLFQIHTAETRFEERQCRQAHGCSPIQYLDQLGVLDHKTILVHAVWVDERDILTMARHHVGVVHCPESNMKLASGIAPVPRMLRQGVDVGLGTDGCASNNDLDLLGEMDTTAKLHKVTQSDPTAMNAETVVRMATVQGARILGLDHIIGSLEAGKEADLIIIDLKRPHLVPLYHPASHLVYTARGGDVQHVMIAGQWVVRDHHLLTLEVDSILDNVKQMAASIADFKANLNVA